MNPASLQSEPFLWAVNYFTAIFAVCPLIHIGKETGWSACLGFFCLQSNTRSMPPAVACFTYCGSQFSPRMFFASSMTM